MRLWTRTHAALYRRSRGRLFGVMPGPNEARNPVLLLATVGRKSGTSRETPLLYLADGPNFVVVASGRGPDGTPDWLRNVEANPVARVRVRDQVVPVRAVLATPEERARLWPRLVAMFARWGEMQNLASHDVPVLVLRTLAPAVSPTTQPPLARGGGAPPPRRSTP